MRVRRFLRRSAPLALLCLGLLTSAPANASYEQVDTFAGTPGELHLPAEEKAWPEAVQLGSVGGMAVNYSGAGGVPKGTLYAITEPGGGLGVRVARFNPDGSFSEAWTWKGTLGGAPEERCGPEGDPSTPTCVPRWEGSAARVDVDVDQASGNVYLINGLGGLPAGTNLIHAYDATGTKLIAEFGEQAPGGETFAESPGKLHEFGEGLIAVGAGARVYVADRGPSFSNRLMSFEPQSPGDYEHYVYAGQGKDITLKAFVGDPSTNAAGDVFLHNEERLFKLDPDNPANPPLCELKFPVKADISGTVDPISGEFFSFSFSDKKVHVFSSCDASGKFAETQKFAISPPRARLTAMAFDPTRKFEPSRPAGVLYAASPNSEGGEEKVTPEGTLAESAMGYVFAGPKGATKTLTVSKTGTGVGTVTSTPVGISCGATCSAEFGEGEVVTLSATPAEGSSFAGWGGACSGTGACEVTMSEAREVTAEFSGGGGPVLHTLKVTVSGEGSVSADAGAISGCTSSGGPSCEGSYAEGAKVTLTETPKAGNVFAGWGTPQCDESTATTCVVTIGKGDEGVAASFEAEPEEPGIPLTVSVEGPGTVTSDKGLISCNPFCSDEYAEGTKVTLTASPSEGSLFMAWKHCDAGGINGRQCTVAMSKAKQVSAVFIAAHALTLAKAEGSGPGKIAASGGIVCLYSCEHASALLKEGSNVTVSQTPAKHFHFAGWGGDCTGKGACELTMGEDHEVTADFEEDPKLSLSLTKTGGGQALIKTKPAGVLCPYICFDAESSFYEGEAVSVSWKLNKGTSKLTWSEGAGTCTGSSEAPEGTCTLSMSAATALAATLE